MDWHDLRYVLAVAQTGTLAGAARLVGVDHTTVGRRVLALEKALKTRLFERTSTGLRVTPAGEMALARARDIEEQMLALEREVIGHDARSEGPVRLTALDAFFDGFLIPRLGAFYARYPNIEVTLVSDMRLLDLSRREADVAIRFTKPNEPKLMARKLGRSASAFYASLSYVEEHGHPTGGWDGQAFVGLPRGTSTFIEGIYNRHGPNARFVLRVNSVGHIVSAARAGVGIGIIPCIIGDATPELCRVTAPVVLEDIWAISHVDTRSSARVRAVVDFLAETVRGSARKLAPRS